MVVEAGEDEMLSNLGDHYYCICTSTTTKSVQGHSTSVRFQRKIPPSRDRNQLLKAYDSEKISCTLNPESSKQDSALVTL